MGKLKAWSTTAASNNAAVPDGFPEGMAPSGVNDSARQMMASTREWYADAGWVELDTATRVSDTQFSVPTDRTADYAQGRRVKAVISGTTIYGTITASAYGSVTTVTVNWDSTQLTSAPSKVELSILTPKHSASIGEQLAYNEQVSNYTLTSSDNGKVVIINSATAKTVTLPQQSTEALPQGFHCIVRQKGAGQITLATEGTDVLQSPSGSTKSREQYADIFIDLQTSGSPNTWHADGATSV
jgi:hypothetical protein